MTPVRAGQLKRVLAGAAAAALAAGMALGVASAAGPASGSAPTTSQAQGTGTSASATPGAGPAPRLRAALSRLPARPLHAVIAARLRAARQAQQAGQPNQGAAQAAGRLVVGRLVRIEGATATVRTGAGQTRQVHILPRTRLPARRPAIGDRVVVLGQPAADGGLNARVVLVRRG